MHRHQIEEIAEKPIRKIIPFEAFMGAISIYGMIVVSLRLFLDAGTEMQELFLYSDWMVCTFFVAAFLRHLIFEPNRLRYIATWGIIDLLSAIPTLPLLRYLRLFRIARFIWLIRRPGSLGTAIRCEPSASLFYLLMLVLILVYSGTCFGILAFESRDPGAEIRTGGDALWFGLVTVSTVGYGDKVPVTAGARICAAILMFTGIGLFASLAGFLLEPLRRLATGRRNYTERDVHERLDELYRLVERNLGEREAQDDETGK